MSPGRIRLKLDQVKGDISRAKEIEEGLRRVRQIHSAEANPLTGSLLITFEAEQSDSMEIPFAVASVLGISLNDLDPEQLSLLMSGHVNGSLQTVTSLTSEIEGAIRQMNSALNRTVGADLQMVVPLLLAMLGLRDLVISEKTTYPSWHDYLWFAFSTYFILNRPSSVINGEIKDAA
jgi:hypothetical protein